MFKCNVRTEVKIYVEPFDDAGEIQVVPIDTVVDDGGCDLEADDVGRDQAQGCGARGKYMRRFQLRVGVDSNPTRLKALRARIPARAADNGGGNQTLWLNVNPNHIKSHRPIYNDNSIKPRPVVISLHSLADFNISGVNPIATRHIKG